MFLKFLQISQERTPLQVLFCEICEIFWKYLFLQNTSCGCSWPLFFFLRTPILKNICKRLLLLRATYFDPLFLFVIFLCYLFFFFFGFSESYRILGNIEIKKNIDTKWIKPVYANGLFPYPLKSSENLWFSDVFRGYRKRPAAWFGLNWSIDGWYINDDLLTVETFREK